MVCFWIWQEGRKLTGTNMIRVRSGHGTNQRDSWVRFEKWKKELSSLPLWYNKKRQQPRVTNIEWWVKRRKETEERIVKQSLTGGGDGWRKGKKGNRTVLSSFKESGNSLDRETRELTLSLPLCPHEKEKKGIGLLFFPKGYELIPFFSLCGNCPSKVTWDETFLHTMSVECSRLGRVRGWETQVDREWGRERGEQSIACDFFCGQPLQRPSVFVSFLLLFVSFSFWYLSGKKPDEW